MTEAPAPSAAIGEPTVDSVLELIRTWGAHPYDEKLSQLDHALQTAALAEAAGADEALVAAALLHDVGHLLDMAAGRIDADTGEIPGVDLSHEASGARWLATAFPPAVTGPIALHVRAKRYLCAVEPSYVDGLTEGSRNSLERQGGPMSPAEAESFAANPASTAAVELRRWDDGGKVEGLVVPDLDHYRPVLQGLAGTDPAAPSR